ncbi:MAG: excinuclease ABC subunit UvrA [Microscillaceae bacterium]|nr:excinuclease ABC subunit UvrA [Microscillaceae bacterium]
MFANLDELDPKDFVIIKGAKVNNLKNINLIIPRNRFIVITGLSGSGKSSLAFDTLFAEGQRMYVESLSSYARQFLGRMEKPDVEYIRGISPAIAVEQKGNTRNPRATVGTTTEIYDYIKLFYARIGITYSPISGQVVKKDTVTDVVNYILSFEEGQRLNTLAPLALPIDRSLEDELKIVFQKGFTRIMMDGELLFIEELLNNPVDIKSLIGQTLYILIDRNVVKKEDEENQYRIADSVQTAFYEGHGECVIDLPGAKPRVFSDRFELDGMIFEEPNVQFFSFNSPYGACKRCGGFGNILAIDENLVIPDKSLSVYEDAVAPWRTEKMSEWKDALIKKAVHTDFPVHRAYRDLNEEEKDWLWNGHEHFEGIYDFFTYVESQSHKIQYRVMMSRYRGKVTCPECRGTRLRKDVNYIKIAGKSISDLVLMPISELVAFFEHLVLSDTEMKIAKRLLVEINNRLQYLDKVGLGYLTLNRLTASLSGGEFQRIKLATALGSALVGSMYILDEPSIGLHPRDTDRLVSVLLDLKNLGNTVIVVEHEEGVMKAADQIVDMGPDAGTHGGEVILSLSSQELEKTDKQFVPQNVYSALNPNYTLEDSHTFNFLKGKDNIEIPTHRRKWTEYIEIQGASQNNLKNLDVCFPLDVLTVVTGVSGSGKSTLIKDILYPSLAKNFGNHSEFIGLFDRMVGNTEYLKGIEFVDQNPIGKSTRSNPATYTKVYDQIRNAYAATMLSKQRGFTPAHFSFNVEKGRCETCQGEGRIKVEMQFMADVYLSCETCGGNRFKKEILEVLYLGKNISEVLELTIDESLEFFKDTPNIIKSLQPLADVGLGYVRLGQSTTTLSGGESQRLKLASYLREKKGRHLFIFDEPTTGLHFHDIKKLLASINALVDQGNSVIVIEHNLEIIKSADWIIDLGPEGGQKGGNLCFAGIPEDLIKEENNHTARFLREKFDSQHA